ncbi:MAG: hypothetical protein Q9M09_03590 [Mariprofundaceae bacterium]|nr:hypothetical protein [Mariprofundaceae bacterium]
MGQAEQQQDVEVKQEVSANKSMDTGNVDKVRQLLFGAQMRDYDKRFVRMEERINHENAALRSELSNRINALESFLKQELGELHKQVEAGRVEQTSMQKKLTQSIEKVAEGTEQRRHATEEKVLHGMEKIANTAEKRSASLDDKLNKATNTLRESVTEQSRALHDEMSHGQSALREGLLDQSKSLRDELQHIRSSMLELMERHNSELRDDKTDRKALAAMFTEMALRLNEEFELPGDELFQ